MSSLELLLRQAIVFRVKFKVILTKVGHLLEYRWVDVNLNMAKALKYDVKHNFCLKCMSEPKPMAGWNVDWFNLNLSGL